MGTSGYQAGDFLKIYEERKRSVENMQQRPYI
jgi:hypothetical protein